MIGIISATEEEISPFLQSLSGKKISVIGKSSFIQGRLLDIDVTVAISGVGLKRARNSTNTLIKKFKPGVIISAGFAGALNPKLGLADVIVADWVLSLKNDEKISMENKLPYIAFNFINGGILTENSFINTKEKKLDLFVKSGAEIVDMETWAIADAAKKLDTGVISVRAVSDLTNQHLPRMEQIFGKESKIDYKKAFRYFKANPSEIYNFLRFKYVNLRKARIRLNSFLTLLIPVLNNLEN